MKPLGRHPEKRLTAVSIRAAKPGRHADGQGLYLYVDPSGAKRWVFRATVLGRRIDMGLGSASLVTLAEAREQALAYRKIARSGGDPLAARRQDRVVVPTFEQAARAVYETHRGAWKNQKHAHQWISTLEQFVFPAIGRLRIDRVGTAEVLKVLMPIWLAKPETARRIRQRIGTVMDWASAAGHRSGENPTRTIAQALPKQAKARAHHAALSWSAVPDFVRALHASDVNETVKLAMEFTLLTATRTGEALGATWSEMGEDGGPVWTIPGPRMKAGKAHRVPLSHRAVEILSRAEELGGTSAFVFPGRDGRKPLSGGVFLDAIERLGVDVTMHGFRSSFRDWASERTNFSGEVAEAALAHAVRNRTEASYRRSDLFERRRELMDLWANFVTSAGGEVVQLRVGAHG